MTILACTAIGAAWDTQLESMRSRLPDVAAGHAIEDLHKFRVALRATRALLKLFRKIIPGTERFTEEFKWLGKATGKVRDLDVALQFVHSQANERSSPAELQALALILTRLQSKRDAYQTRLRLIIGSDRCRNLFFEWPQFIGTLPDMPDLPWAARIKASTLLPPLIIKQCRQLLLEGKDIDAYTAAYNLHRLRIRCKGLRYLLESFYTLLEDKKIKSLLNRLVKLQNILGKHQDSFSAAGRWQQMLDRPSKRTAIAQPPTSKQQQPDRSKAVSISSRPSMRILQRWLELAIDQQLESRAQLQELITDFSRSCKKL